MERYMNSFNQSQKPTKFHVSLTLLAYAEHCTDFYDRIHLKLYRPFMLFPTGRMNVKNKIKIYKKNSWRSF